MMAPFLGFGGQARVAPPPPWTRHWAVAVTEAAAAAAVAVAAETVIHSSLVSVGRAGAAGVSVRLCHAPTMERSGAARGPRLRLLSVTAERPAAAAARAGITAPPSPLSRRREMMAANCDRSAEPDRVESAKLSRTNSRVSTEH